nr:MAG TPA: hypothetical protein [Caudoviricetes sp.]
MSSNAPGSNCIIKWRFFRYQNARNDIKTKAFYIRFCREKSP